MNNELNPQHLHDRVTRGETLTAEEQRALDRWYAHQDQAEAVLLGGPPAATEAGLQQHIQTTLDQLGVVTARIQAVSLDNEAVRRENAELRRRLAQRAASSAA